MYQCNLHSFPTLSAYLLLVSFFNLDIRREDNALLPGPRCQLITTRGSSPDIPGQTSEQGSIFLGDPTAVINRWNAKP